jgi:twitching motility protein PilT
MTLDEILRAAVRSDASDVMLKAGNPPGVRIHGDLLPLPDVEPLTHEDLQAAVDVLLDDYHRRRFTTDLQVDLAYETPELGRFRVNVFRQRGERAR